MSNQDILARSATTTPSPQARNHAIPVAKLIDVSKCIGCKACQTACSEWNDLEFDVGTNTGVYDNPHDLEANAWTVMRYFETEGQDGHLDWTIRKDGCMHCQDPGCLKACPSPGAIIKYANGIVDFNSDNCIGCGYCVTGCPFNVPRISKTDHKAYKCTLCSDRVAVGLEPACVKTCPTGAIMFGTKEAMIDQADERIVDLNERGYQSAGLYNPEGVGGTHVMYVLKDAKNPGNVHLPVDPTISPLVSLWKGVTKPLASFALGAIALGGFLHYITVGPKDEPVDDHGSARRRSRSGARAAPRARDQCAQRHPRDQETAMSSLRPPSATRPGLVRYTPQQRANHWLTAIAFMLLAASGLGFFHPAFFPLTFLLGSPQWARILHPWIGVFMFASFIVLAVSMWARNRWAVNDTQWIRQVDDVIMNRDDAMPAIGKYNPGQKLLFYTMVATMIVLLLTGIVIWRSIFGVFFPVPVHRVAVLLHAFCGFVLMAGIVVHVYSAIWVKGSIGAMVRGSVSRAWARHHHPLWYREVTGEPVQNEPRV